MVNSNNLNDQQKHVMSVLARLERVFGKELNDVQREDYTEILTEELTPEQLNTAVAKIKKDWKPTGPNPFPAIPDFLEAAGEGRADKERREREAEMLIVAEVRDKLAKFDPGYGVATFRDLALSYTVRALQLFNWKSDDWKFKHNMDAFLSTYRAAKKNGLCGPKTLTSPGFTGTEIERAGVTFLGCNNPQLKLGRGAGRPEALEWDGEDDEEDLEAQACAEMFGGIGKSVNDAIAWNARKK